MNKRIIGILVCTLFITNVLVIIDADEELLPKEKIEFVNFSQPIIQENDKFVTLSLPEATSYMMKTGKPILPIYTKVFTFSFGTTIDDVECNPEQIITQSISGKIQPSPKPALLTNLNNMPEKKVFGDIIKDNTIYESIDFFPNICYDYNVGCGLDDTQHVEYLTVNFYPVRYSPGLDIIEYANKVEILVKYHEPIQPVVFQDEYDMVIISPTEFIEKLQPLVDYKNDSGVVTKLVTLDEIYNGYYFPVTGRDDQEKIKYFLKNSIEQWNITYALLAGGENKIPVRMSYVQDGYEQSIISDLYYSDIYDANNNFCSWDSNNNDIFGEYNYQGRTDFVDAYPDICLGRLAFRGSNEVTGVVDKIINYESTGAYMEDWFQKFVVCGGDSFPDYSNADEGEYLNQNAIDMMDGFIPDKIWVTNGRLQFGVNVDGAIENGTGFLYMTGHGTDENWATHPHNDFETWWPIGSYFYIRIDLLYNFEKVPIVIIGGCSNCEFAGENCFGWSFVKNAHGGGIAAYGNSALGWGYTGYACTQGLTGAMELSAFKAYKIQNAKTTGDLWTKALTNYLNQFGIWSAYDCKTVEEWEPFNDPSMRISKVSDKPGKPDKPNGPTFGEIGINYTYSTLSTDPDNDMLKYCFDWDDGTITWTDRIESGENAFLIHQWEKPGTYEVRGKARDAIGLDSEWSEPLSVNIVSEAAYFDILKIFGGFSKVRAVIKNIGLINATDVNCSFSVVGGLLRTINVHGSQTFENLSVGEEKIAKVNKIFGFGKINITLTVSAPSANVATKSANGFIFGSIIFVQ